MESILIMETITSPLLPNKKTSESSRTTLGCFSVYLGLRISRLPIKQKAV